ncbi:uncharacterized protein J3R85_013656 [Psidium guajava]|nr:uncharacterized protein J3R85_013656 [Psidium guajava]
MNVWRQFLRLRHHALRLTRPYDVWFEMIISGTWSEHISPSPMIVRGKGKRRRGLMTPHG